MLGVKVSRFFVQRMKTKWGSYNPASNKLPKVIVDAVKKNMPGARITKAAKLEDGNFYLDEVKVGKKLWDVTISPKGEIIMKVEMKD